MSSWAGRTLGKVRIDTLLARGGMAEVYLGMHTTLQREVVVKILRNYDEEDPILLDRFQLEARVVAKLRHPNIVQVFDFDMMDEQPYIVMEYIAGPSLSRYLKALHGKNKWLGLPNVARILNGVASALQYAHDSGVIHRDIKPGNILLTSRSGPIIPGEPLPHDFQAVLTDFGLVRILSLSQQTTVGRIAGTPAYMSPEQARGEQADGATDIYSLGIVLYELLAGHVPFDGESTVSILLKHVNEPPPPIPGLAAPLQNVLDRALAKDPSDRFKTPDEFMAAFDAAAEESAEASTIKPARSRAAPLTSKTRPRARPFRRWVPATLAGLAALTAIGAFSLFSGLAPFGNRAPTASPSSTAPPTVQSPVGLVASPLGPTGFLRFEDESATMDRAVLTASAMPAPPKGNQYEVWLVSVNGGDRRSLGVLTLDESGRGTLTYDDARGQNLLALYNQVEVTITPATNSDANSFPQVAYSYSLPENALEFVRRLLVSSPLTPERVALIQGLHTNARILDQTAKEMLRAHENGDQAGVQEAAEAILNLLVGDQSQEHKDWNNDRRVTDPGDGYGFWLNGDHSGYIQVVYSHADYAANAPGTSQNMIINGARVKTCAENLAQWTPQLRDRMLAILDSNSSSDEDQIIQDSVALVDQILNGTDQDDSGTIEPIMGECGVLTTYQYAYYMADMLLLPVNLLDTATATGTPSPTATFSPFGRPTNTSTRLAGGGGGLNTPAPPANTAVEPPNTSVPPTDSPPTDPPPSVEPPATDPPGQPTKKPKETKTPRP